MFKMADPIWCAGLQSVVNIQCGFRAVFVASADTAACKTWRLAIAAATFYKLYINSRFVAYGPAVAPHGYSRVDGLDVSELVIEGANELYIEVAGYNCYSFSAINQISFVRAELSLDNEPVIYTGRDFTAFRINQRRQKVMRYSYQRTFSEVWDFKLTNTEMKSQLVSLYDIKSIPRNLPFPDYTIYECKGVLSSGSVTFHHDRPVKNKRFIENKSQVFTFFPVDTVESRSYYELLRMDYHPDSLSCVSCECDARKQTKIGLKQNEYALYRLDTIKTGFIMTSVLAHTDCRILICFDEKLTDGVISPDAWEMINCVEYRLGAQDTAYNLETFEVYSMQYIAVIVTEGDVTVISTGVRSYMFAMDIPALKARLRTEDEKLLGIYTAAMETFRQNTVDIYMDCPSRERAGWLCDSYFTAQSEMLFTGDNVVERAFMENYRLYNNGTFVPKGMLPMCYPADHTSGRYIPQWCLWYVIELEQFFERSRQIRQEDYRRLCYDMIGFFKQYENEFGLLENLPSWNFIEWSDARGYMDGVHYPTNMLYTEVLSIVGSVYADPQLAAKAQKLRETIIRQAFDGELFIDNSLRDEQGRLVPTGNRSEVCQYYAVRFKTADLSAQRYKKLKFTILNIFGPNRYVSCELPDVALANVFIGIYLRMEILYALGEYERLLDEIKLYFSKMADTTGTLWEHLDPNASLNHGFASFAGVMIEKALGQSL